MMPSELGDLLRAIGWERSELADRLNVSAATVSNWISGRRPVDDRVLPWLRQVADAIDAAPPVPEGWAPRSVGRPRPVA